jgi:hypothetical protein
VEVVAFEVPGIPPGPNSRRHWFARARDDARWRRDASLAAVDARNRSGLAGFPWPRVGVRYTFYVARRGRRDPDNLVACAKNILDGAVDAGLLADDSAGCVVAFGPHDVVLRPGKAGVRVAVERLP